MNAHQIWQDRTPHNFYLKENCDQLSPGEICISWYVGASAIAEMKILSGNQADEFLERYRAAPDPETKELVMLHAIEGVA